MEEEITRKPYIVSRKFNMNRENIYEYTLDTFGYFQAERYKQKIRESLDTLPDFIRHTPNVATLQPKVVCTVISYLMLT
jgi:plasmid stabilization system protein ParE